MSSVGEKISKKWVYIPVYVLILLGSVWFTYDYLNREEVVVETTVLLLEDEVLISDETYDCIDIKKRSLGGTFALIPTDKLASSASVDVECYDKFCDELSDIELGLTSIKSFYRSVRSKDKCLKPILDVALDYHLQQLESLPVLALFYDSGQDKLSSKQRKKIFNFFKKNVEDPDEQGILIIGRASRIGSASGNKRLSKKRAERIIDIIDRDYIVAPDVEYVHFGSDPPQLNKRFAKKIGIVKADYENIDFGSGLDPDASLRLNQSVLLVIYPKDEDPFDIDNEY